MGGINHPSDGRIIMFYDNKKGGLFCMELQVRLAYDTAQMLEQLKEYYELQLDITFTKSDVLSKAIIDTNNLWGEVEWDNLDFDIKEFDITKSALRPKLQVSKEIEDEIKSLRKILSNYLGLEKFVTIGVAIKYVFRLALNQIQQEKSISANKILFETLKMYLKKEYSEDQKKILNEFVDEVLFKLEDQELL